MHLQVITVAKLLKYACRINNKCKLINYTDLYVMKLLKKSQISQCTTLGSSSDFGGQDVFGV